MKKLIIVMMLTHINLACATPPVKKHAENETKDSTEPIHSTYIGSAKMLKDRTIVMVLFSQFPGGDGITEANLTYRPDDPKYLDVLHHLGGMRPGQSKLVPPWKETLGVEQPTVDELEPVETKIFK